MNLLSKILPFLGLSALTLSAQQPTPAVARPKLVVGIAIDQMRWDYLYRFQDRYTEDGFKRVLREGFSCENALISHVPAITAVGHAGIFTGSVPAIHGITGNDWIEQLTGQKLYCTEDKTVKNVGGLGEQDGQNSPRNLLVTTIGDELRVATNYQAKVIGVSLKDRASIIPAGHTGQAFWYEDVTGNFITSTYYSETLPEWVSTFNASNVGTELVANDWTTFEPIETYTLSTPDDVTWENKLDGEKSPVFPHNLAASYKMKKGIIRYTPFGNTLTLRFAQAAVEGNGLGQDDVTDLLTINCASTDYVGHKFGPNSIEIEDTYIRLDRDLAEFFKYLDAKVGKGNYTVFISADHAVANNIGYMKAHGLPANNFNPGKLIKDLNAELEAKLGYKELAKTFTNYMINFDLAKVETDKVDFDLVKKVSVKFLQKQPGVLFAVDVAQLGASPVPEPIKGMIANGYNSKRCGDIQVILNSGWMTMGDVGTTHGAWNPYDTHIPLLFMGWGIKPGASNETVYMTDIAPTISALLHIQMPSGCVGKPVQAVLKK